MKRLQTFDSLVLMYPHTVLSDASEAPLRRVALPKWGRQVTNGWISSFTHRVKALRRRASQTYLVVHRETNGEISDLSPRFNPQPTDIIIESGVMVNFNGVWLNGRPNLDQLVPQIAGMNVVVGGFHSADCVTKMIEALEHSGRNAYVAPLITELQHCSCTCIANGSPIFEPIPPFVTLDELKAMQRELRAKQESRHERMMEEFVR